MSQFNADHTPYSAEHLEQRRTARKEVRTNRRLTGLFLASAALATTVLVAANPFPGHSKKERAAEDCVSELAGHRVDLVSWDSEGNSLQMPSVVYNEMDACLRSDNNPAKARESMDLEVRSR